MRYGILTIDPSNGKVTNVVDCANTKTRDWVLGSDAVDENHVLVLFEYREGEDLLKAASIAYKNEINCNGVFDFMHALG